jgi:hypothetical protein
MTTISIIHAGNAAPKLKQLLNKLDSVGGREKYFMTDLIGTLQYDDVYTEELNIFMDELLFGEFYPNLFSQGRNDSGKFKYNVARFMEDTAMTSKLVLRHLHETLQSRGLYNKDGRFPYEFDSFNGRIISLRRL